MEFDQVAEQWDNERRIRRAQKLVNQIRLCVPDLAQKRVLEFGCGTGLLSFGLLPYVKEITGYDLSVKMREVYKSKIVSYDANNARVLESLEMAKGQMPYDLTFSSMVFHHILDVKAKVCELKSLLSENGIFLMIDLDEEDGSFHQEEEGFDGHNGFSRQYIADVLKESGLEKVEVMDAYQGEKEIANKTIAYSLFLAVGQRP